MNADPTLALIDYLREDFIHEWLIKAVFHYRWYIANDARKAEDQLPRWTVQPQCDAEPEPIQRMIAERRISRLYGEGFNVTTAPVIEAPLNAFSLPSMSPWHLMHSVLVHGYPRVISRSMVSWHS